MPEPYRNPIREADVEGGHIRGAIGNYTVVTAFRGIPYAAPPIGENRWRAPQPVIPWEGTRACVEFGPAAYQVDRTLEMGARDMYPTPYERSEDCLYLNVWTSAQSVDEKQPVFFWSHGGGNFGGYGHEVENDGEGLASRGIVVVTYNYRLSHFGFLAHPELSAEDPHGSSGNYGILDAITALTWVRNNIAQFGGDPNNITIGGQSAGCVMTQCLMSSPITQGMFTKVALHSGVSVGVRPHSPGNGGTLAEAEARGEAFVKSMGCSSIAEMRKLSPEQIFGDKAIGYGGNIDNYVLTDMPGAIIARGEHPDVPYLVSGTADETNEPRKRQVLGPGNKDFCENQLKYGMKPTYAFRFSRRLPGVPSVAYHTSELFYLFETFNRMWRPMTGSDFDIAKRMVDYWANFIKTGNPNGDGLPVWVPYTEQCRMAMDLGDTNDMMDADYIDYTGNIIE